MVRTAFLVTSALAVAALGIQVPAAHGEHSWGSYHWRISSTPLTLTLGDNLGTSWKPKGVSYSFCGAYEDAGFYLDTACSDWSKSKEVVKTTVELGNTRARTCKPTSGRVEVCSEKYGFNGWLGLAQIWISDGHITQGITKLNDSYFNTRTYNTPEWRHLVMCQEIGHTFGLGHNDEDFKTDNTHTCMDYTNYPAGNEHPNEHDYVQLGSIYGHTHLTTETAANKPGKGRSGLGKLVAVSGFEFATYVRDDPSEWGTAVAFTSKGQPRLFVKDLGDGEKVVTHVTWTEDARAGAHFPHRH